MSKSKGSIVRAMRQKLRKCLKMLSENLGKKIPINPEVDERTTQ